MLTKKVVARTLVGPVLAWGGLFFYPALARILYYNQTWTMAWMVFVIVGLSSPKLQSMCQSQIKKCMSEIVYLNELPTPDNRATVYLVTPHGSFCEAGMMFFMDKLAGYHVLLDRFLFYMSPLARWCISMTECIAEPLTDMHVKQLMKQQHNLALFPGGFVECNGYTNDTELIYTAKIPYWLKRCAEYNYRLCITVIYEGSRFSLQPELGLDFRLALAKFDIPCIIPIPAILHTAKLFVRTHVISDLSITNDQLGQLLLTQYNLDKEMILKVYGMRLKQPRIVSRL
jgi:hypothetical protein